MGLFDALKPKNEFERMLDEAKKLKKQNETDALYQFEHLNFRQLFFDTGAQFIDALINRDDFIYFVYSKQCELMRQPAKYSKEQFILSAHSNEKGQIVFKLIPPEPYRSPLCYKIYMTVDVDGKPLSYKTLEMESNNLPPVLCGWASGGTHYNYGSKDSGSDCGLIAHDIDIKKAKSFTDLLLQAQEFNVKFEKTEKNNEDNNKETNVDSKKEDKTESTKLDDKVLFCKHCGAKLDDDSIFCSKCGTKVER